MKTIKFYQIPENKFLFKMTNVDDDTDMDIPLGHFMKLQYMDEEQESTPIYAVRQIKETPDGWSLYLERTETVH